jgi:hypothetical protein
MSAPIPLALLKSLQRCGLMNVGARRGLGVDLAPAGPGTTDRRWLLTVHDGELAHRVMLMGPPTLVGSGDACDVQIDDPRIGVVHIQIVPHDEGAIVRAVDGARFECHGGVHRGDVEVAFGTPFFLGEFLMLTLDPWFEVRDDGAVN